MADRICPIKVCGAPIGPHWLMCWNHWAVLPRRFKRRSNVSWYRGGLEAFTQELAAHAVNCVNDTQFTGNPLDS